MRINKKLVKILNKFQLLPVGYHISNPKGFLLLDIKLSKKSIEITCAKNSQLFFTRISLKHIAEKQKDSKITLEIVYRTLKYPDQIYKGRSSRFIFSKTFQAKKGLHYHAVTLEVLDKNIIVTAFKAKQKYLKNFEILWRSASLD